ncbi:putative dehydrogenase [Microbacterium phyllosphaerae]|uniref:Dehydrogenase n=1 Tax=Microbacterium phyllosphaerae TaxID=124798 RepID=A0ABS4WNP7_9MICO|nr:Gfo/Idh/MocA family oxidoreductase [Microbacterium phyllosphaerae]MBP2377824.1 putative dehydrogenase [Microbacterium phyllosphaerae]
MTIRTAIIGYGTGGRVFHGPLIDATEGLEVSAIVTSNPDRSQHAQGRYPRAAVFDDVDALFAAGGFDLLVVTSPNETHVPFARRAVDAGIPVVLDKPLATSVDDARAIVDDAERAGVLLTVFQNRRWDGDFLTLREVIAEGALGDIHQFDSAFEWWAPELGARWKDTASPEQGGGILFDLGPHLIDQALMLFGDVIDVHGELDNRRGGGADDDAFVSLTHASGVRSRLWMSAIAPSNRPRFRVVGSTGVFESHGLDPQEQQAIAGMHPTEAGFGVHDDGRVATLSTADGDQPLPLCAGEHRAFYALLLEALTAGRPLPVDPADSIRGLQLIESARGAR